MNEEVIELPKLKVEEEKEIIIDDNNLSEVYDLTSKRKINYYVCIVAFIITLSFVSIFIIDRIKLLKKYNYVTLDAIDVVSYDSNNNIVELSIEPSSEQEEWIYINSNNEKVIGEMVNNKCVVTVRLESGKVSFTNSNDDVSTNLEVSNYVVDLREKSKYYLALNSELELGEDKVVVGAPVISWVSLDDSVQIIDNKLNMC